MTIQTQQEPPKHRGANGLHDDVVALKVDVATLKEQGKHFATKEDVADLRADLLEKISVLDRKIDKARNDLLYAVNRAAVGMIVFLGGILVTLILK